MALESLLDAMTRAACAGDGGGVADCFTSDGVYHDVFYGVFRGRVALIDLIEGHIHRDGGEFRWDVFDVVEQGERGYARYIFSYLPRQPVASPVAITRAVFEGIAVAQLRNGLIADYDEVVNPHTGLSLMGLADERIAKFAAKQAAALRERPEAAAHFS